MSDVDDEGGYERASILITGANRGIGLATTLALARAGHRVFATMRDPTVGSELADVAEREGLSVEISAMDVDSTESVNGTIGRILDERGALDVLVNNAGIERRGSTEELDLSEFRGVMETNYFGPLRCIKAVVPRMRTRGSGCIVSVSSVAGRISCTPLHPYSASKFALEALSEGLAQELKAFGIRVAIVQPGIIDTGMARALSKESDGCLYPHTRRLNRLFTAALRTPVSPSVVGDKIREIVESGTWQLRHPVGPDAEPFLAWRASMSDEEWVDWWSVDDDDVWDDAVERDLGLDVRSVA